MSSLSGNRKFLTVVNRAGAAGRAGLDDSPSTEPARGGGGEAQLMPLPVLATANDLREVVQYLKKRPDGVDISEVPQPLKKRVFYPPKVAAYESWGVVSRRHGRVSLTRLGWEFARSLEPGARSYRLLLRNAAPFRAALGWMWEQGSEVFTQKELADFWREEFPAAPDDAEGKRRWESAVCLFHLCQAAELGTLTIGKRGHPARLRVLREELGAFLHRDAPARPDRTSAAAPEPLRVGISCRRRAPVVEQVRRTLDLMGIRHEMSCAEAVTDLRAAPRGCEAGIVVITKEDAGQEGAGAAALPGHVLSEIGRAFLDYGGRVLLLWDEEVSVPTHLGAMRRCLFRDGGLTWEAGVELLKALKDFATCSRPLPQRC
jgi:hypothetical protein